ncbi:recombinase family protein [Tissierella sp.]|uniref:recombinase family protein n=1 Tax=Tissierella sp. TaxID=41274 RepID=UPI002860EB8D|nr:recombinase family protein [Tissierella sp.]MDR7856014.1 recombinase family protein [Tissierella sp.]
MKIAIYSRKSKFTGKGESIENQILMCKEYANRHFENIKDIYVYEDEGFSGGNINRPKFQELMNDAREKKFDVLICYRLDRVSRDVADFSSTIEELNNYNIAFVSIKEQFDTSTPMGRAMMYIASVFSQLERETISERIKDNMLQLATTGRWLGGVPPLGFESEKVPYLDKDYKEKSLTKLKPISKEMDLVEFFYDKYLELGSIHQVRKFLIQNNYKTKNDAYFSTRVISDILRNPAYSKANEEISDYLEDRGISIAGKDRLNGQRGILIYNKINGKGMKNDKSEWIGAVAKHIGTINPDKWLEVQKQLDVNNMEITRTGTSTVALLGGILKCAHCGSAMNIMYGRKREDGTSPHYYVCNLKTASGMDKCNNPNVNGIDIDYTIIEKILELSQSKEIFLKKMKEINKDDENDNNRNIINKLENRKKELLNEIDILVNELPKNSIASNYILPQIENKDKELQKIKEEIIELEKSNEKTKKESDNVNFVVNNIVNFAKLANELDNEQKKCFIQTIVDKIYWNGEDELLGIQFFTNKDIKLSKYRSTSSRSSNQNHSIRLSQDIIKSFQIFITES